MLFYRKGHGVHGFKGVVLTCALLGIYAGKSHMEEAEDGMAVDRGKLKHTAT
jgi:hypothetical protein